MYYYIRYIFLSSTNCSSYSRKTTKIYIYCLYILYQIIRYFLTSLIVSYSCRPTYIHIYCIHIYVLYISDIFNYHFSFLLNLSFLPVYFAEKLTTECRGLSYTKGFGNWICTQRSAGQKWLNWIMGLCNGSP